MRYPAMVLALSLGLGSHVLHAQDSTNLLEAKECLAHLPSDAFTRVPVYAYVHIAPAAGRIAAEEAESFLPHIAAAVSRELHGTPGALPRGDSAVNWQAVDGSASMVLFRDGRFAWQTPSPTPRPDGATALLARALAVADSAGARRPLLPRASGRTPSWISFAVVTTHPKVDHSGHVSPTEFEGTAVPIFSLPIPWHEQAAARPGNPQPRYPHASEMDAAVDNVVESFIVDTSGRVVMSSVGEIWPSGAPPLTGERGRYGREYVAAVHEALRAWKFDPARIGGCPLPLRVQQLFQTSDSRSSLPTLDHSPE